MSYILDALRRAEAERGRGGVPGLHTQATPVPGALPTEERTAPSRLLAVTVGVLVVAGLAAAGTWWAMQRSAPTGGVVLAGAQTTPPPGVAAVPSAPASSVPSAPTPAATPSDPTVAPTAAPAVPTAGVTPSPAPAPAPRSAPEPRPAPPAAREKAPAAAARPPAPEAPRSRAAEPAAERAPTSAVTARQRESLPAPATATAGPTGTVFAQSDLPDAVRAQLPVLKISGATYSTNPTYRMAIVNGQVLHEGDLAAPGLMLEKIEPGRTIWSFKGYRYGLASQ